MQRREGMNEKEMKSLQARYPSRDPLADKLGLPTHYGPIEEAEEKRFPWLRDRRRRKRM